MLYLDKRRLLIGSLLCPSCSCLWRWLGDRIVNTTSGRVGNEIVPALLKDKSAGTSPCMATVTKVAQVSVLGRQRRLPSKQPKQSFASRTAPNARKILPPNQSGQSQQFTQQQQLLQQSQRHRHSRAEAHRFDSNYPSC